ncbi:hypothetical protein Ancab_038198 [Ancistrocladus abbreviatus]
MKISKFQEVMQQSKARNLERIEKSRQQWRIYKLYFKRYQNGEALECYFIAALVDKKLHPETALKSVKKIASMSKHHVQIVLYTGVLTPLLALIKDDKFPRNLLDLASHTLTILFRGKPPLDQVKSALPTVRKFILFDTQGDEANVCLNGLLVLSYITDGPGEQIQAILEADISQRLVIIMSPLEPDKHRQRSYTGMVFSDLNCTACINAADSYILIIDAGIIPHLLNILKSDYIYDTDLQSMVVEVILPAIENGSAEEIDILVKLGCLTGFCKFMASTYNDTRFLCLQGLKKILQMGRDNQVDEFNEYALRFLQLDGFNVIRDLLDDCDDDNRELALLILDRFDPLD